MAKKKAPKVTTGPNPARVAAVLALRSSGASGAHKQARRPVRAAGRRAAIEDSRAG